jgi:hypothetical protein
MLGITKVLLEGDYIVSIEFNDGQNGLINLKNELEKDHRAIIQELLDLEKFNTVKIKFDTLSWDNGVDFAPEYLYEQMVLQKQNV